MISQQSSAQVRLARPSSCFLHAPRPNRPAQELELATRVDSAQVYIDLNAPSVAARAAMHLGAHFPKALGMNDDVTCERVTVLLPSRHERLSDLEYAGANAVDWLAFWTGCKEVMANKVCLHSACRIAVH